MAIFTGSAASDVANATTGNLIGFTGGTVEELEDDSGDIFFGLGNSDTVVGGPGEDEINAGPGDDNLNGGGGADIMRGGVGNDTYLVDDAGDKVIESFSEGSSDGVGASVSFSLPANVELLELLGTSDLNGNGNELDNIIAGNVGANILSGRAGNDTLTGLSGNDILNGGPGNDLLDGGDGNDILNGGAGIDNLSGGTGDDIYEVNNAADVLTDSGGIDLVRSKISYTLLSGFENLVLRGSDNLDGTGNELNNFIDGSGGENVLSGLAGNDVILGEKGNDTLLGGDGNDELQGGLGADDLAPGAGADVLSYRDAEEGNDTVVGFDVADDSIAFLASGFGGGLTAGETLVDGTNFISGSDPQPTTAEGTVLYDTDGSQLSWDVDGTGPSEPELIATFDSNTNLTVSDFLIV